MKDVKFSVIIGGNLSMPSLVSIDDVEFSEIIDGYLSMRSLKRMKDVKLPTVVNKDIYMNSLESVEEVTLPQKIRCIYLGNLKTLNGFIFPDNFEFKKIYLANDVVVTPENIHEYINRTKSK